MTENNDVQAKEPEAEPTGAKVPMHWCKAFRSLAEQANSTGIPGIVTCTFWNSGKFENYAITLENLNDAEAILHVKSAIEAAKNQKIEDVLLKMCGRADQMVLKLAATEHREWELKGPKIEAIAKFRNPKLLELLHNEISIKHLYDSRAKLAAFLAGCTIYLPNPKNRVSVAFLADTSVGKDNLMHTIEWLLPEDSRIFLTNATQSVLEDDISDLQVIFFSEQNANRDDGANVHLIEAVKQLSEGGMSAFKKDTATGFKEAKLSQQEQKVIFYATTEERRDEETETRFLCISISGCPAKIKAVNANTCDSWASLDKPNDGLSWVTLGLEELRKEPLDVVIHYATFLKDKIDCNNPRSQRDFKRVMKLTAAMTWLHQLQRTIIEHKGQRFIISEPVDFLNTLKIAGGFLNQSYMGLEARLHVILDFAEKTYGKGADFQRDDLQKQLGIRSANTIKKRLKLLTEKGLVEFVRLEDNKKAIYKLPVNPPISNLSLVILDDALIGDLIGEKWAKEYQSLIDTHKVIQHRKEETMYIDFVNDNSIKSCTAFPAKIDGLNLMAQKSPETLSDFIKSHAGEDGLCAICDITHESTGFTIQDVDAALKRGEIHEPQYGSVKLV